jgi:hypothetical protein
VLRISVLTNLRSNRVLDQFKQKQKHLHRSGRTQMLNESGSRRANNNIYIKLQRTIAPAY